MNVQGYVMAITEVGIARNELIRLIKMKNHERYWLVKCVANRILVDETIVNTALLKLKKANIVRIVDVKGKEVVSLVLRKRKAK